MNGRLLIAAMVHSTPCEVPRQLAWQGMVDHRASSTAGRIIIIAAAVVVLIASATWSSSRLDQHLDLEHERADLIYLPPANFLRGASLGYQQALADLLWFRAISYFGRHYRSDRIYPWLASMCDAVTDLDPRAEYVYRFGGVILPWEADRVDDGIALLQKGARNVPESWQLHYMLGFSYYFFRDDLAAASQTLREASFLPGAPGFVTRLAAIVDAAHQGPNSAVDFLTELAGRDVNGEMREVIRQRIRELSLSEDIDSLEAAAREFQARAGRPPADLEEVVAAGLLPKIPEEPFGGRYDLDRGSGRVVSTSGHKPWRLGSSQLREAFLKAKRLGD